MGHGNLNFGPQKKKWMSITSELLSRHVVYKLFL